MFQACLLLFFKTGPMSQNGIMVFYVPMIAFFTWIAVFSYLTLKAVDDEVARRRHVPAPHADVVSPVGA